MTDAKARDREYMAVILDGVSDAQAATLPVAGLTALATVDKEDRILGHSALITAVTGGVGFFALQLAKLSGAKVGAQVRRPEQASSPQIQKLLSSPAIYSHVGLTAKLS